MTKYDSAAWTGRPHPPRLVAAHGGIVGPHGPICAWGMFSNGRFDIAIYRPLTKHEWALVPEELQPIGIARRVRIVIAAFVRGFMSLMPYVRRGEATWCGKFFIIHAPVALSRMCGHGEAGLYWRWTERGHAVIRACKAEQKRREQG